MQRGASRHPTVCRRLLPTAAQRIGGHFELTFQCMRIIRREQVFKTLLLSGELVEVRPFLGIGGIHLVEALLRTDDLGNAFLDDLAHGLFRIEFWLLFEETNLRAGVRSRLADEFGVGAGHDAQHGRLASTVHAEQADLRAGVERQRNVLDDLAFRRDDLADADHRVDVLHVCSGQKTH